MDLGLHGKRVLITGGSRGIGFAVARALAAEQAAVGLIARDAAVLAEAAAQVADLGAPVAIAAADVTGTPALHRAVDEIAAAVARVDRRMDATIARTAIVRYDAYEQAGGRQSASVALLDANRSGVVLSAIQGRDYARVYVKELDQGKASVALSPEEQQAVERAMAR